MAYPAGYRNTRRALIRRFPYGVVYLPIPEQDTIVVLAAVLHCGRDPKLWKSGQAPECPCPPTPSPTYERLRDTIAKRMRMSHVDQPLMLMELLGHGLARQQPAQPPRRT
jgi:hypothetical protein